MPKTEILICYLQIRIIWNLKIRCCPSKPTEPDNDVLNFLEIATPDGESGMIDESISESTSKGICIFCNSFIDTHILDIYI